MKVAFMSRLKWITAAVAIVLIGWLAEREVRDRINKRRAYPVIAELGGRIASITPPIPFAGSQIAISFRRINFDREQLQRLSVLKPLMAIHHVGLVFVDSNITDDDVAELRRLLPGCNITRNGSNAH